MSMMTRTFLALGLGALSAGAGCNGSSDPLTFGGDDAGDAACPTGGRLRRGDGRLERRRKREADAEAGTGAPDPGAARAAPAAARAAAPGGGSGGSGDAGAPTGSVGISGGSVSRLLFAVVGDTRPPNPDDTSGYPTTTATKIFDDLDGMNPKPSFGVSTGDYMYVNPGSGQAAPQLDLYIGARGHFSNVMFPTMGNHECNGYTDSNCGSSGSGDTENYKAFLGQLLAPLKQTNPYYSVDVNSTSGAWTAKFIFVAANAWSSTQESWLETTMAKATTYTFLVRHEPKSAGGSSGAPGVDPAESVMAKYPYTLSIVGHSHLAEKSGTKEVIFGNGGAPLSGGTYGFGLVTQLADGNIQVDNYDYDTVQPDSKFRFTLTPAGVSVP